MQWARCTRRMQWARCTRRMQWARCTRRMQWARCTRARISKCVPTHIVWEKIWIIWITLIYLFIGSLEQTQQNGTKAASSLPPPLCVQALPTSSWLLNASNPGYSLSICMSSRSKMIQTLCTSFRNECVGKPQGVWEFGYGNGWTSTGGCSMVTIIGLCMGYGIRTLPVTLISSMCHPTCSTSFSADWVY